jgi:hypothetical protein
MPAKMLPVKCSPEKGDKIAVEKDKCVMVGGSAAVTLGGGLLNLKTAFALLERDEIRFFYHTFTKAAIETDQQI